MTTTPPITRFRAEAPTAQTCTTILILQNAFGLHARPAALLARRARDFDSEISMKYGRHRVNAKSIMGLLTLGVAQGAVVGVTAEGHDAREAVRAIEDWFASSFHTAEQELATGS